MKGQRIREFTNLHHKEFKACKFTIKYNKVKETHKYKQVYSHSLNA